MKSCLLIKPGSMGDVIHALPVAAAIKRARPDCALTWLVDDRWAPLLEANPHLSDIVIFPRQRFRGVTGPARALPWATGLRRLKPDCALDLQGLLRSALMAVASGAKRRIGLSDAREGARWFYETITPVDPLEHAVRRYLRTLENLQIERPAHPEFPLPPGQMPPGLDEAAPYILLHPFARGAGKSLSSEAVRAFCSALAPARVVVAGQGRLTAPLPGNAIELLNRTSLPEMIWLIRHARFVISVDSGPMHIAAAVNPRLLSLHTWSDPRLVGPFSEEAWIWQGGEIRRQNLSAEAINPENPDLEAGEMRKIADWVRERLER